jgi:DNA end-binding protein Ku
MRAIWSGSLSFGLINIPVKLYSASEERGLNLDMLDKATHKPIGYARVIRGTHQEVKWENIVKGYKYRNGDYIVLLDEDFKAASPEKTRTIDIVSFTAESEIDPKYYEKPYYLEPDAKSTKAYALLREALAKSKKVAVASFVMREREHVAIIKPAGNVLMLEQLRWDEDIRSTSGLNLPAKESFKERELEMALQLVEHLTAHFDAKQFKDTYTEQLMQVIEAKAKGRKPRTKAEKAEAPTEDVDDLLAILQESLASGAKRRLGTARRSTAGSGGLRAAGQSGARDGAATKAAAAPKTATASASTARPTRASRRPATVKPARRVTAARAKK